MASYKVVGVCSVAGVAPGGVLTDEQLHRVGANVAVLLDAHLERIKEPAAEKPKPKPKGRR